MKATKQSTSLTVALIQHQCHADQQQNITTNINAIRQAAQDGAKLVVLPELHTTQYFCQSHNYDNFDLAQPIPGAITEIFARVAKQENIVLLISLFERYGAGIYYNTADPGYHEKFYFTPGDAGFLPIKTSIGKLGVLICWDQWYPEAARLMTLAGADILIYPTAIGWDPADDSTEQQRQLDAWITIQRSHAIANGIALITVNRVGFEADSSDRTAGADFWGNSFIAGPQGEFIAHANHQQPTTITAAIDLQRSEQVRRIWPFLRDRRIDAYEDLTKRWLTSSWTEQ